MVTLEVSIDKDELTPLLDSLSSALSSNSDAIRTGATAVKDALVAYHTEFAPRWKGDHYLAGGNAGQWEQEVIAGWQDPTIINEGDNTSVLIQNTAPYLAHKVEGGTITPTSAQFLTIPLVPEAKGVRAREFGEKLFVPKGTRVLAMSEGKSFIPIYALVESVTQAPWPGALPETDVLADAFMQNFQTQLDSVLETTAA